MHPRTIMVIPLPYPSFASESNMFIKRAICCIATSCFLIGLLANGQIAIGQGAQPKTPTIHTTGQHELKLPPQRLRLTRTMRAEGLDAKSAIRSLADHKTKVKSDLMALKADEASISFGATRLTTVSPGCRRKHSNTASK
jgi:hypothetical protein